VAHWVHHGRACRSISPHRHAIAIAPPSLRNVLRPEFNFPRVRYSSELLRLPCLAHRPPRGIDARTCLDFPPSSRLHALASTSLRSFPSPRIRFVPRFSQPLDAFLRTRAPRACFIPLPRPGPSRSGSSPLAQPSFLVGRSVPPGRCSRRAHHRSSVHTPSPRLRGLNPRESALLRAPIIHRSPRSLPSSGFSPPGLYPLVVHPSYSGAPLVMFLNSVFAFALAASSHLQRLLYERTG